MATEFCCITPFVMIGNPVGGGGGGGGACGWGPCCVFGCGGVAKGNVTFLCPGCCGGGGGCGGGCGW